MPLIDAIPLWVSKDESIFQYKNGEDVAIVSLNFSLRDAIDLDRALGDCNINSSLFHLNYLSNIDFEVIIEACKTSKKLIVIDDSKSISKFSDVLVSKINQMGILCDLLVLNRGPLADSDYGVNQDRMIIDFQSALDFCSSGKRNK